jgi:hypothetical protein
LWFKPRRGFGDFSTNLIGNFTTGFRFVPRMCQEYTFTSLEFLQFLTSLKNCDAGMDCIVNGLAC